MNYKALFLVIKSYKNDAAIRMELIATLFKFYFIKNRFYNSLIDFFISKILKILKKQLLEFIHKSILMIVIVKYIEEICVKIKKP